MVKSSFKFDDEGKVVAETYSRYKPGFKGKITVNPDGSLSGLLVYRHQWGKTIYDFRGMKFQDKLLILGTVVQTEYNITCVVVQRWYLAIRMAKR